MTRDHRIEEEARQLWHALHGGPPPPGLSGSDLLMRVLEEMECDPYDRLTDAHERRHQIAWPIEDRRKRAH